MLLNIICCVNTKPKLMTPTQTKSDNALAVMAYGFLPISTMQTRQVYRWCRCRSGSKRRRRGWMERSGDHGQWRSMSKSKVCSEVRARWERGGDARGAAARASERAATYGDHIPQWNKMALLLWVIVVICHFHLGHSVIWRRT